MDAGGFDETPDKIITPESLESAKSWAEANIAIEVFGYNFDQIPASDLEVTVCYVQLTDEQ